VSKKVRKAELLEARIAAEGLKKISHENACIQRT
jgi:hypothetical protein